MQAVDGATVEVELFRVAKAIEAQHFADGVVVKHWGFQRVAGEDAVLHMIVTTAPVERSKQPLEQFLENVVREDQGAETKH